MAVYTHFETEPVTWWWQVFGQNYQLSNPGLLTFANTDGTLTKALGSFLIFNGNLLGVITTLQRTSADGSTIHESITGLSLGANAFVTAPIIQKREMAFAGSDVLNGFSGRDVLDGEDGSDELYGHGGPDSLDGDLMFGGSGDDQYIVDDAADIVIELAGEGNDSVFSLLTHYALPANVENLRKGGASGNGFGNELDNVMTVSVGGQKLYGLGGNDRLVGGGDDDLLDGGDGNDTLVGWKEHDTLTGAAGNDTFTIRVGHHTVTDFVAGSDKIHLQRFAPEEPFSDYYDAFKTLSDVLAQATQNGADTVIDLGGFGNSLTLKNVQKDSLTASDFLGIGGPGSDVLVADKDVDVIDGDVGDDTVVFSLSLDKYTVTDRGNRIDVSGPDGFRELFHVEHLQFTDGTIHIEDGSALFDTIYYMRNNLDVFHAGVNARDHYNTLGWQEGRDPSAFFDTSGYLAVNKDVAASGVNPLEHYHQAGWKEGRDPYIGFDTTLYLLKYPDVAAAGVDPLEHYLLFGRHEFRKTFQAVGPATNGFDAQYYLFKNPDVAAAGVDPLGHFNAIGWQETRNPNAWFDTAGYLSHYTDVAAAGANPLAHYMAFGWKEGRDPSAKFDTLGYLAANPDVAAAGANPLEHFLTFGIYEGRQAVNDGMWH